MEDVKEWHKIGNKLTKYLDICHCQRKLKSIIDNLYSIYEKNIRSYKTGEPRNFTGAEWALIAMMDSKRNLGIDHGINCEYPIIIEDHEFWQWIIEVKDNPNLEDN